MAGKPPFDPSQPFEPVAAEKPPFDPSQPFEATQAQGAREVAAGRTRQAQKPQYGRQQPSTLGSVAAGVRDAVEQGGTGINEGLARSVARPLDVIPYAVSKALGGEGVHPVENTFRGAFVDNHPPATTDTQRVMRAGGNMVGDNLPFSVAGVTAAAKIPALAVEAAATPAAGNIWQTFKAGARGYGDAMARQPGKAFISDNVGAGEAGAGGEAYRQVAEDSGANASGQHGAEIAGQFGVPAAVAAYTRFGPGGAIRAGTSKLVDTVLKHTPEAVLPESLRPSGGGPVARKADQLAFSNNEGKYAANEGVNDVPTKDLPVQPPKAPGFVARKMDAGAQARADEATNVVAKDFSKITARPEAEANLAETNRLKAEIPGFEPGIAKGTNDPALLNKQANFDSKAVNDDLRSRQNATDSSRDAIRKYMDETVPPAGENPQDRVAEASKGHIQGQQTALGAEADAVQRQIQQRSDALPQVDRAATGQTLREVRHGEQAAADAEMTRLRGAIANPETPIRVGEQEMTVNHALDRRAAINQRTRAIGSLAQRDMAAFDEVQRLGAERDHLDRALDGVNTPGMREYTNYYRTEYAPKFLEGPSRDVGRYSQNGIDKNKVQSEDVPGQFFKPNNISEARQFNRVYGTGDAPETAHARRAMTDYALDDLRHSAMDPTTQTLRPGGVDRWLQKNERILNEMPWIRDAVQTHNPEALHRQLGEIEQRQRTVADSKLGQLAKNGNPEAHIAAGINDWQVMRDLKRATAGDPQAEAALRRAVWDHVLGAAGGEGPINADAIQRLLLPEAQGGHRRSLAQVLSPQHMNNLENVMGATRIENRLDRPTGTFEKPTTIFSRFEDATGTSVPTLGATASALARGRSSPVYEVPRLVANAWKGISEREINGIWKEALSNPDVAKQLAVVAKGGVATPMQIKRMHNYTLALGIHDAEEDRTK